MTTIINPSNGEGNESFGSGLIIGIIVVVIIILLFVFLRNPTTTTPAPAPAQPNTTNEEPDIFNTTINSTTTVNATTTQ